MHLLGKLHFHCKHHRRHKLSHFLWLDLNNYPFEDRKYLHCGKNLKRYKLFLFQRYSYHFGMYCHLYKDYHHHKHCHSLNYCIGKYCYCKNLRCKDCHHRNSNHSDKLHNLLQLGKYRYYLQNMNLRCKDHCHYR